MSEWLLFIGSQNQQRSLVLQCSKTCFKVIIQTFSNFYIKANLKSIKLLFCQDPTIFENYWVGGHGHPNTVPRGQDVCHQNIVLINQKKWDYVVKIM